jgi:muconate cycloisomerase
LPIRRVDAIPVALPLRKPVAMSDVIVATADNLLVRIEAKNGTVGWGEAAAAPSMTGDTLAGLTAAVRGHLAPLLVGEDAWERSELQRRMRAALYGNSGAHAAIEMALLDLAGRASATPLIELVGGAARGKVAPMWLLGNPTIDADIAEAETKVREGFRFFKLKIGTKALEQDIEATHAVRGALERSIPLCADANCGLSLAEARRYLERAGKLILFLEQPLDHADLKGLESLARRYSIPIGADEAIHSLADIEAHARCGGRGVSLKLIKLGGIANALAAGKLCRRLGLSVNVAAKIAESSIGSAAALHLACGLPKVDWGVSLTHFYLAEDVVKRPLSLDAGTVALPQAPGLGIEVDEGAVERMRV